MTLSPPRFPEIHDLVAVTIKQVEYYGYVSDIDYDMRHPSVKVEFYPGYELTFDFDEITIMSFPKKIEWNT